MDYGGIRVLRILHGTVASKLSGVSMEELPEIDRTSDALLRINGNLEMSGPRSRESLGW
jgi:hypothetical protein